MPEFDWDEANIRHIAEHEVTPEEAEQVLLNDPFDLEYQFQNGEERFLQIGETDAGRILIVAFTLRSSRIRVVTAYTPQKTIRTKYILRRGKHGEKTGE